GGRPRGGLGGPGGGSGGRVPPWPPPLASPGGAGAPPPLVTFVPSTMMVTPRATPASSSTTIFTACWPSRDCEPRSTEARPCSVTLLARSTTAAGRSSYRRPTTHCASCRLSEAILSSTLRGAAGPPEHRENGHRE